MLNTTHFLDDILPVGFLPSICPGFKISLCFGFDFLSELRYELDVNVRLQQRSTDFFEYRIEYLQNRQ